jgi:hypothetical protein
VPALLRGQPLVELDGPHLLEQVDHRVAVAAQGQPAPASCSARLGPMPSPRSRSVVGQKQTYVRAPEEPHVVAGEVGGVDERGARAEEAGVGEHLGRVSAVRRTAGVVLATCSERWTCSGRPSARRRRAQLVARHRADRVDRPPAIRAPSPPASSLTRSPQPSTSRR